MVVSRDPYDNEEEKKADIQIAIIYVVTIYIQNK